MIISERVSAVKKKGYWIIIILKGVLTLAIATLLYNQVIKNHDIPELVSVLRQSLDDANSHLLIACISLVTVNWFLESLKWKVIVSSFRKISLRHSLMTILAGLSVGILTPGRIGEYGGRFYMMDKAERWKALSATFVSSLSQNIITIFFGLLGGLYLVNIASPVNPYLATSLFYFGLAILIAALLFYYHIGLFQRLVRFLPQKWESMVDQHSLFLNFLTGRMLDSIMFIGFARYLVYSIQYLLLLYFFGINVPPLEALAVISIIFLIQTGLPFPPLVDILARGEIAIVMWSLYSQNHFGIIAVAFGLWLINLILPALIGLFCVIVHKD